MSEPDSYLLRHTARPLERGLHSGALWPALLVSVAVHFAAFYFLVSRVPAPPAPEARSPLLLQIAPVAQAYHLDVVDVAVAARAQPEEPAAPAEPLTMPSEIPSEVPGASPSLPRPGPAASVGGPREAGDPSLDRLRYGTPMADVWRRADPLPVSGAELTEEEILRARVASRLGAYNDSVAGEAAARARATDWTVKDADGGRWGVSPGAIHLGTLTLPLPFTFSTPPGRREEVAGRLANWTAIQQQSTIVEGREIVKDRIKAIEQRKAAERAARQNAGSTGTSGTSTPPRTGGGNNSGPGGS